MLSDIITPLMHCWLDSDRDIYPDTGGFCLPLAVNLR